MLFRSDDLVGFENARTEAQRKVLKEWFYSSLYPTLEPDGEIHILGTRYSPMDLYEDLIKSKNYKVNVQQAITVKDGQEYSLWESKFSLEKLRCIREEAGLIIFTTMLLILSFISSLVISAFILVFISIFSFPGNALFPRISSSSFL